MKLGRLSRQLGIMVMAGVLSWPVLGASTISSGTSTVSSGTSIVSVRQPMGSSQVDEEESWQEKEITFMKKYGEPVNLSMVKDNLKLTIEYALTDTYNVKMLMCLEKIDGVPFKSEEGLDMRHIDVRSQEEVEQEALMKALPEDAPFEERFKVMAQFNEALKSYIKADGTVDMEGLKADFQKGEAVETATSSSSYGMSNTKENTGTKIYFTYSGSYSDPITKAALVSIETIIEEEEREEEITLDLIDVLKTQQNKTLKTKPNEDVEGEKRSLEEIKESHPEQYERIKERLEQEPKALLVDGGLGLHLIEGDKELVIDNIGFVDGKLHVLMLGEGIQRYELAIYDKDGEWVSNDYRTGSSSTLEDGSRRDEDYYVYDIGTIEELSEYQFKVKWQEIVEEWEGPWEFTLDMSKNQEVKTVKMDETITLAEGKKAHLKEIRVGKVSVVFVLDEVEDDQRHDLSFKLILKDGSERNYEYSNSSSQSRGVVTLTYDFHDTVGEEVQEIQIGDQTVYRAN